jgi:hypothetical protein
MPIILGVTPAKRAGHVDRSLSSNHTLNGGGSLMSQSALTMISFVGVIGGFLGLCHVGLATVAVLEAIGDRYLRILAG